MRSTGRGGHFMEGFQGDIGLQVLQAVQALGGKMDRLEQRMDRLEQRMDQLEQRMDRLEQRVDRLEQRVDAVERRLGRLEQRVDDLDKRVTGLEAQVGLVGNRMDKQEVWMERLGIEFIGTRERLEAYATHGVRGPDGRLDHASSAVVLLAEELRGPTKVEYSPRLEGHLRELKVH